MFSSHFKYKSNLRSSFSAFPLNCTEQQLLEAPQLPRESPSSLLSKTHTAHFSSTFPFSWFLSPAFSPSSRCCYVNPRRWPLCCWGSGVVCGLWSSGVPCMSRCGPIKPWCEKHIWKRAGDVKDVTPEHVDQDTSCDVHSVQVHLAFLLFFFSSSLHNCWQRYKQL